MHFYFFISLSSRIIVQNLKLYLKLIINEYKQVLDPLFFLKKICDTMQFCMIIVDLKQMNARNECVEDSLYLKSSLLLHYISY